MPLCALYLDEVMCVDCRVTDLGTKADEAESLHGEGLCRGGAAQGASCWRSDC